MINRMIIQRLDDYLDSQVSQPYKDQPLAQDWARISKIGEEFGEVIDAFIGTTGQNPRKGVFGSEDDVDNELVDVILTAILALQHRTKDIHTTALIIRERLLYRMQKAGLEMSETMSNIQSYFNPLTGVFTEWEAHDMGTSFCTSLPEHIHNEGGN
jgi:hypothetical protein